MSLIIPAIRVHAAQGLNGVEVFYDGSDFYAQNGVSSRCLIQRGDLSKELRGISSGTLSKVLEASYLNLKKAGNDYSLSLMGRLNGGSYESLEEGSYLKNYNRMCGTGIIVVLALSFFGGIGILAANTECPNENLCRGMGVIMIVAPLIFCLAATSSGNKITIPPGPR